MTEDEMIEIAEFGYRQLLIEQHGVERAEELLLERKLGTLTYEIDEEYLQETDPS